MPRAHGLPPAHCAGRVLLSRDGGHEWSVALRTPGPVVAVSASGGALWAVETSLGLAKRSRTGRQPGVVVFVSRDRGRSWTRQGHIDLWLAGVRQSVQLLLGRDGRLLLSVLDLDGCAMHGCSPDDVYLSRNDGRTWRLADPRETRDGVAEPGCGLAGQVVLGQSPDSRAWASEGPPLATCSAPATTLFAAAPGGGPADRSWAVVQRWPMFRPLALAWPARSIGYALGPAGVTKTTDGGRGWSQVLPEPSPAIAVHAISATVAYGVQDATDQGAVTQTTDGSQWRLIAHLPLNLSLIDFPTARDGVAIGTSWNIATHTTTWQLYSTGARHPSWTLRARLPLHGDQQVSGLWMADAHRGLILVSHGAIWPQVMTGGVGPLTLWQTADGGRTWTRRRAVPFSDGLTFSGASFTPNSTGGWTGWLLTSHLEATSDTGQHWHRLAPSPTIDGAQLLTPRSAIAWDGPHNGRASALEHD